MADAPTSIDDSVPNVVALLESVYRTAGLEGEWAAEHAAIEEMIGAIRTLVDGTFSFVRPLGVGGSGMVFLMLDQRLSVPDQSPVYSVMKLPRPVSGRVEQLNRILQSETMRLRGLRHPNLIRIQNLGMAGTTPYFVMEAMPSPEDADAWLAAHPTLSELIRIVEGAARGIAYLHSREPGIAHLDIKPSNLFVNDSSVVVADLGFAKRVGSAGQTASVGGTRGYMHPAYELLIQGPGTSGMDRDDSNRQLQERPIEREELRLEWDLYSLGVTLLVLLRVLEKKGVDASQYAFRYLKLMSYRMLGEEVTHAAATTVHLKFYSRSTEEPPLIATKYLGLRAPAFQQLAYLSIGEVIDDLGKLTGSSDLLNSVPELQEFPREVIHVASHGAAPHSDRIARLLKTPEVRRLASVDQLGLVRLVYPAATHSRLEHSLGTLAMSSRFTRALYSDPVSPLFKQLMGADDLELLLAVCLLHDIGHYPLAHDLEEVSKAVFGHEDRTSHLLRKSPSELESALSNPAWSATLLPRVRRVLGNLDDGQLTVQEMLVKSIIDGPVDADKIDYLLRDSENLRLPYGHGIDVWKLLQSLTVIVKSDDGDDDAAVRARIGITDKGKIPAESVAFARYSLYGSVYWHRTHRTLKAMLNRLGLEAMSSFRTTLKGKQRAAYLTKMREALYAFLEGEEDATTLDVYPVLRTVERGPYFDHHTEQVVRWLAGLADKPGFEELATALLKRQMYDRILVLTRSRSDAAIKWTKVDQVFGRLGERWQYRRNLMQDLEAVILARLATKTTTEMDVDNQAKLASLKAALKEHQPVILVDFPPLKVGSPRKLEYLREEGMSETDPFDVANVEASSMWTKLSEQYSQSLGKLRVYANPEWSRLIISLFSQKELREMLAESLASVSGAIEENEADGQADPS